MKRRQGRIIAACDILLATNAAGCSSPTSARIPASLASLSTAPSSDHGDSNTGVAPGGTSSASASPTSSARSGAGAAGTVSPTSSTTAQPSEGTAGPSEQPRPADTAPSSGSEANQGSATSDRTSGASIKPPSLAAPRCTTKQLTLGTGRPDGGGNGGLGHAGLLLLFHNSGAACQMGGYPGIDGLDAKGNVVAHARRTKSGYLASAEPADIIVPHGGASSALLEGSIGPSPSGPPCPRYSALVVTPPGETNSVHLRSEYPLCYLEIHPVVAGVHGGTHVS